MHRSLPGLVKRNVSLLTTWRLWTTQPLRLAPLGELPKTWKDVKILMRKTFVDLYSTSNLNFEIHSLEEQPTIASLVLLNILQEVEIKKEKETIESNINTNPIMSRSSNSIFNK
jgi:hypothetical protein